MNKMELLNMYRKRCIWIGEENSFDISTSTPKSGVPKDKNEKLQNALSIMGTGLIAKYETHTPEPRVKGHNERLRTVLKKNMRFLNKRPTVDIENILGKRTSFSRSPLNNRNSGKTPQRVHENTRPAANESQNGYLKKLRILTRKYTEDNVEHIPEVPNKKCSSKKSKVQLLFRERGSVCTKKNVRGKDSEKLGPNSISTQTFNTGTRLDKTELEGCTGKMAKRWLDKYKRAVIIFKQNKAVSKLLHMERLEKTAPQARISEMYLRPITQGSIVIKTRQGQRICPG